MDACKSFAPSIKKRNATRTRQVLRPRRTNEKRSLGNPRSAFLFPPTTLTKLSLTLPSTEQYKPDRIIIECSGSAFPATLAFQLRELERETEGDLKMDAIVTVIDAENFIGYEDTSPTAKMQASYTDVILIVRPSHILSSSTLGFHQMFSNEE
jgi:hypothetical protein